MMDVSNQPQPSRTSTTTLLLGNLPAFITRRNRSTSVPPPLNLESTTPSNTTNNNSNNNNTNSSDSNAQQSPPGSNTQPFPVLLSPGLPFTTAARPLIRRLGSSGSSTTSSPSLHNSATFPSSALTTITANGSNNNNNNNNSGQPSPSRSSGFSNMLRRSTRRDSNPALSPSTNNNGNSNQQHSPSSLADVQGHQAHEASTVPHVLVTTTSTSDSLPTTTNNNATPSTINNNTNINPDTTRPPGALHRIRLVPHLESTRSLPFEPIIRDAIENGPVIRVGRFTDRQTNGNNSAPNAPNALKIAFRSKVVSRGHAEIWVEEGGKFFIRDTKSSSGTFLNHIRLANANVESRPFPLKDGDIIQLGIDYQGGQQEIYRCVKIKVEIGREWQSAANAFNTNALRRLNNLGVHSVLPSSTLAPPSNLTSIPSKPISTIPSDLSDSNGNSTDCCICLFPITVCQALFVAPCSHAFHYKCLRPMLVAHHPGFSCPLCRSFADLESDVEVDYTGYDRTGMMGSPGIGVSVGVGVTEPPSVIVTSSDGGEMVLEVLSGVRGGHGGVPQPIPEEDEAAAAIVAVVPDEESHGDDDDRHQQSAADPNTTMLGMDGSGGNEDEVEEMVTSENEGGVVLDDEVVGSRANSEGLTSEHVDGEEADEEAEVEGHVNSRSASVASDAVGPDHHLRPSSPPRLVEEAEAEQDERDVARLEVPHPRLETSPRSSAYDDARSSSFSDADVDREPAERDGEEYEDEEEPLIVSRFDIEDGDIVEDESDCERDDGGKESEMEVDEEDGVPVNVGRRMRTRSMGVGVSVAGTSVPRVLAVGGGDVETSRTVGKRKRRSQAS